ncbi:unannotated protein [freshwater metagenome]|uniref:Unannotated protein n=1 Tax=freshwater metagenome TaxID=449393 RepID=A0A6J6M7S2_9ZZZZ|nr:helix-turn-helix domain-containing protein [Actinomycetota bacterium]MSY51248.1 helix-turn-helix domain-containing protein [Actinomycetota bacterium]MSY87057.1 helix-turn-helix domain-containing protein [Actinomycetota bacterium]MTA51128.1 helix-turn-helix domain-containing protein [Actinomycetota bacterium]
MEESEVLTPAQELGIRLREVRKQQKLSLNDLEERSSGRWKSVVVGSYERGDRSITAVNLERLAAFYGVPVSEFFPDPTPAKPSSVPVRPLLDLTALRASTATTVMPLKRFALGIERARGDWNGQVLSMRRSDLALLSMLAAMSPQDYISACVSLGIMHTPKSDR